MAATVKGSTVKPSTAAMEIEEGVDELDRCAVEEVELTVPKTDDPTLPVLTFRIRMPLSITGISAQIAVVPLGHLMARVLPNKKYLEGSRPKSVLVNQLGSGEQGLGIGAIGIDWATISSYLGSPLASPVFATINVTIGFLWAFHGNGSSYDVLSIIDNKFHLDRDIYAKTGPIHMSTFFAITYGLGFATLSATMVHVLLFHGSDLWKQTRGAFKRNKKMDIHTRIMKKNYRDVPMWWFLVILVLNIALIVFISVYYNATVQLPWWGVLLACAIAVVFTPLIGVIVATTNQAPGLNVITEYVIGYIYPERPVANMCFKVYGYISMTQALTFIQDFKLGLYMKIPPMVSMQEKLLQLVLSWKQMA
ncbi:hypothetical protein Bca52824_043726 [Brassica carinata]|uniref:Uncharacterized protein n=1 Tax=Brassica carinata TaxID=52824 RepID=A0A8X7RZT3_BRACI|nr:hypothetical protein Bca52824_043726 [Brassica carinata]